MDLEEAIFASPTQVCLVPGPVFGLPQGEAFGRGAFLVAVTDWATILRETTEIPGAAKLTLRARDGEHLGEPGRLRVFRKDPGTGIGVDAGLVQDEIQVVDFEKGKAASFPITRFGSYVVAIERPR